MFHVISARLARLARRTRARLGPDYELAARNGWQVQRAGLWTWCYRDPRFDQIKARPAVPTGRRS